MEICTTARQKSTSCSLTEAEYKALANAAAEVSWVQNLLTELGLSLMHETCGIGLPFCMRKGSRWYFEGSSHWLAHTTNLQMH
ncbi:hypothetical protein HanRHA438_Chr10g0431601 [Helianthus annuus]|nr:hypothetical protein HanRHA438_Chr10g0431601 [Helianthus annuus]